MKSLDSSYQINQCILAELKDYSFSTLASLISSFNQIFFKKLLPADSYQFSHICLLLLSLYMKASTLILTLALAVLITTDTVITGSKPSLDNKVESINQRNHSEAIRNETDNSNQTQKNQSSLNYHRLPATNERNQNNIYDFVDHAIKEKYWYYLSKACLLYLTSVDQGSNNFQFLAIYRNIVGTFLAITTWTKGASNFQVNTLVRLGDGDGKKLGANYKPIAVRPLELRYNLGANQVVLEYTDSWDIKINGKCIECNNQLGNVEDLCVKECQDMNSFAQNKFWYYLENAKVIYSNVAKTSIRNYCLITYLNEVGTFLIIGSKSSSQSNSTDTQINTFVRLGNGCASGVQYKPASFSKIKLPLSDYTE